MFIRPRTNKTKSGAMTESYQVLETYRENGKVKQKLIAFNPSEVFLRKIHNTKTVFNHSKLKE